MNDELYKEIDKIVSDLVGNNFIVTHGGRSDLYDQSISFLKSKGLIKPERHNNRYVANSNDIYHIKEIGIKEYLKEDKHIKDLELKIKELTVKNLDLQNEATEYKKEIRHQESQILNLTRDNLRLNNWDIRFRWYIAIGSFLIGVIIKYFMDK